LQWLVHCQLTLPSSHSTSQLDQWIKKRSSEKAHIKPSNFLLCLFCNLRFPTAVCEVFFVFTLLYTTGSQAFGWLLEWEQTYESFPASFPHPIHGIFRTCSLNHHGSRLNRIALVGFSRSNHHSRPDSSREQDVLAPDDFMHFMNFMHFECHEMPWASAGAQRRNCSHVLWTCSYRFVPQLIWRFLVSSPAGWKNTENLHSNTLQLFLGSQDIEFAQAKLQ
jgi:hypothetical protein